MKLGILTVGHIHTPNFIKRLQERPEIQVAGVYDPNPKLAAKCAGELNAPVVDTAAKILNDKSIDAVAILGTTVQHDDLIVPAALAGKHMFAEKPLAVTGPQANRMFRAIKDSGVTFQTGHFMRSNPKYRFMKQELDAVNLGTVTRVRGSNCHCGALAGWFDTDYRWFFDITQAGGGGFYDLGCHTLDIMTYLFGPVASATGAIGGQTIKYPNIDEYGEALLRFANGITGTLAAGWVDRRNPNEFEICGTEGHLQIHNGVVLYQSSKSKVPGADGSKPIDTKDMPAALPHAFDLFFDVLLGKASKADLVPVEEALHVSKAMEAIYLGDKIGSWVKVV